LWYEIPLLVPAGTTADNPAEAELQLTHGIITRIEVEFPWGTDHLVSAYVRAALHQIWPLNPEGKVVSEGGTIGAAEYIEMLDSPYVVTVGAYGPACVYDHNLRFRVELSDQSVAERGANLEGWMSKIMKLLGVKGS
jgi:hypothetical protein